MVPAVALLVTLEVRQWVQIPKKKSWMLVCESFGSTVAQKLWVCLFRIKIVKVLSRQVSIRPNYLLCRELSLLHYDKKAKPCHSCININ